MKKFLFFLITFILFSFIGCKKNQKTEKLPVAEKTVQAESGTNQISLSKNKLWGREEEEEFIENEIEVEDNSLEQLENPLKIRSPIIQKSKKANQDEETETEPVENIIIDSQNRLKFLEYGNEIFIPQFNNGNKYLVQVDDKNTIRFFYNDDYKLLKKETWHISDFENSKIISTEEYKYSDITGNPVEKIIQSEDTKIRSFYNDEGLVVKAQDYKIVEDKPYILSITAWTYNKDKQVIKEEQKNYNYSDTTLLNTSVKKQLFIYNDKQVSDDNSDEANSSKSKDKKEQIPPDYEYYEDGVLKIRTTYSSKGTYSNQIFFDEINSVTTYYQNYVKVKDVYKENDLVRRVKNYE